MTELIESPDERVTTVGELFDVIKYLPRDMPIRGENTPAMGVFLYGGSGCPRVCMIQDYDDDA